jgi:hypothetical protein
VLSSARIHIHFISLKPTFVRGEVRVIYNPARLFIITSLDSSTLAQLANVKYGHKGGSVGGCLKKSRDRPGDIKMLLNHQAPAAHDGHSSDQQPEQVDGAAGGLSRAGGRSLFRCCDFLCRCFLPVFFNININAGQFL